MKYAVRIYFWCHFATSLDFITQECATIFVTQVSKGRIQACKSTSGCCPCAGKQAGPWDADRQRGCAWKPAGLFAPASGNDHWIHRPSSITCTRTFQHNSSFRVICLLQKETLKQDLSITFGFGAELSSGYLTRSPCLGSGVMNTDAVTTPMPFPIPSSPKLW